MTDLGNGNDGSRRPIKRALVSVYDKTDLLLVADALVQAGAEIVSTGSTAETIAEAGLPVTPIEKVTGFPECLDGRVKTLHPMVHAGLLADLRLASHRAQIAELGVEPFDLLISNLYPFTATVASGAAPEACISQIDIGGPAMVRSSAKNHASVAVITSPDQYPELLTALVAGGFTLAERQALAAAAFVHTATYDVAVASWMGSVVTDLSDGTGFPRWMGGTWEKVTGLRYGENPHQPAALYRTSGTTHGLANAHQLHGKEMSYNNYVDADAARRCAGDFDDPAVAIIKHANPCGVAVGLDIAEAHRKAHACDPISAYGGVIAANRPVSLDMARQVAEIFTEVIIAPGYAVGAVEVLAAKKNLRILAVELPARGGIEGRRIDGGLLVQHADGVDSDHDRAVNWQLAAGLPASDEALADLEFAWKAARSVKSNAILLARDGASVGVGMGQVNRVDSCRLAVQRAGERAAGSVAASDAF
ncbi:MAG TPA: bifunctional phosphoribosylaminoimidazolecarboxamide formyltransferase/IMP cyclohydrolase, partial [Propionibacteriaceae bacterium]|nr:bifunctional phosphoribosylaminoimidazolecarboxamide formyltransferase/IMP cyclohydrolase [Propionibacteriaceae bacterium]